MPVGVFVGGTGVFVTVAVARGGFGVGVLVAIAVGRAAARSNVSGARSSENTPPAKPKTKRTRAMSQFDGKQADGSSTGVIIQDFGP